MYRTVSVGQEFVNIVFSTDDGNNVGVFSGSILNYNLKLNVQFFLPWFEGKQFVSELDELVVGEEAGGEDNVGAFEGVVGRLRGWATPVDGPDGVVGALIVVVGRGNWLGGPAGRPGSTSYRWNFSGTAWNALNQLGPVGWRSKFETTECRTSNISEFQNYEY